MDQFFIVFPLRIYHWRSSSSASSLLFELQIGHFPVAWQIRKDLFITMVLSHQVPFANVVAIAAQVWWVTGGSVNVVSNKCRDDAAYLSSGGSWMLTCYFTSHYLIASRIMSRHLILVLIFKFNIYNAITCIDSSYQTILCCFYHLVICLALPHVLKNPCLE